MVATVLKLRYRSLGNTLARRPWQLVGFCVGIVWGLSVLGLVVSSLIGVAVLGTLETARTVATIGGSALLLGWIVGPLMIAGVDTTIDAEKLSPFPLTATQVRVALVATGLTGIPGIITTIATLATVAMWVRWPVAAVIGLVCALLAVLTCVLATRAVEALATGLGGNRRGRELVGTLVLLMMILAFPLISFAAAALSETADLSAQFSRAGAVLGWTPLGAAWAVPGDIAAGEWVGAAAKLVIAAATPAVLWVVWSRAMERRTSAPAQSATRAVAQGVLGLFGRMPTGGVGATWARALTGWLRDPRYLRQLLAVPLFPVLFAFAGGIDALPFASSPIMVALVLSISSYSDISYDGTAFASVLATGIRGRDDRLGRILGAASIGVPLVVVIAVITSVIGGRVAQLPAFLGASLGLVLAGYAVSAVSSALLVVPVAAAGDSPFKTVPGQTFVSGLFVFVVLAACCVLAAPSAVLAGIAIIGGDALWGWLALLVGLGVGIGAIAAGVALGGRALDRTGPDLLTRIKAFPVG